ncbi:Txe/YoeB family addiction module toxin [Enterococcus durans]|uniref:Txe/YoeB family addiction module toxin n=1 Tax=Enterococcus durans TaxID=53345 RepID=UPI0003285C90|nr:Txe/YoeB family addiction module toxin [Enterococcus durans]EMS76577.1 Txe/YoeB family addiction module toxin [Enterococcus durans IPLA 655]QCJ64127.1 Txe/YoeB family addiction module toxin [Lactobacillus sp. Koumiss]AKX86984.1 txe/YoeB family addiction module toxin [Enterococcus durans]AKZ48342.1 txe/YoeB family addiction module toxin [Enterococcus durans]MBS5930178.1 Txe/YoeB family addiction module toxin [Enterococcus durans]
MGYNIKIKKNARKDLPKLKGANLNDKFDELITVIRENPYQNPPPYEKLMWLLYYSRRINIKYRLVYNVEDQNLYGLIMNTGFKM